MEHFKKDQQCLLASCSAQASCSSGLFLPVTSIEVFVCLCLYALSHDLFVLGCWFTLS